MGFQNPAKRHGAPWTEAAAAIEEGGEGKGGITQKTAPLHRGSFLQTVPTIPGIPERSKCTRKRRMLHPVPQARRPKP